MSRVLYGGGEGDRTLDLIVANDALSQLSYTPKLVYVGEVPIITKVTML